MQSGKANCRLIIKRRTWTVNDFGENTASFTTWREPWAESWVDRGAEPVQANEPQSAPIRNFRLDWGDVYLAGMDGTVLREDMSIEVDGETYVTPDGQTLPRTYDIRLIKVDHAMRKWVVIVCIEARNPQ